MKRWNYCLDPTFHSRFVYFSPQKLHIAFKQRAQKSVHCYCNVFCHGWRIWNWWLQMWHQLRPYHTSWWENRHANAQHHNNAIQCIFQFYPDSSSRAKRDGSGSTEATEMILNNLFYITTKVCKVHNFRQLFVSTNAKCLNILSLVFGYAHAWDWRDMG